MQIQTRHERKRGCGYRKPGVGGVGVYAVEVTGQLAKEGCHRLPLNLSKCPTCNHGISFSRGFTWINPKELFGECPTFVDICQCGHNAIAGAPRCIICNPPEKAGLLWVGEKFYTTPEEFLKEAVDMGVSKRLNTIPKGFEIGVHSIFLAHKKAIRVVSEPDINGDVKVSYRPGIFAVYTPELVELVIGGDRKRVPARAAAIAKRLGKDKVQIVKIVPVGELLLDQMGAGA